MIVGFEEFPIRLRTPFVVAPFGTSVSALYSGHFGVMYGRSK